MKKAVLLLTKTAIAVGTGWIVSSMVADTINLPSPGSRPSQADRISRADATDCGAWGAAAAVAAVGIFNRIARRFS